ncbi:hypothetical protein DIU31_023425 [Mucilaginibacter rubeus]|uniref:Uncharacterized protein n=1 Tax=Mucilaginibacter rubeus TaxID=2027860 RepID=A0AAE6JIC3_9SPHI|nr:MULTISPECIES: hypothetical protein [Mucilaginibacter]QEM06327.1 hypothetical protein DIU31_023425 [Mucilaginibacter rubeus]QEM18908.1 hypothetical protein DIU38_023660 [Mucilaginibacter gossypii]QTE44549.1 hypothetical protein J3L19_04055 [Mucilaginibacter rubeus]QTE51147.1 hypothetical protein J3L21_04030 [Mucilaginibacter rubeus]QTE56233.1 hypothetical protein J3L23_29280 [Mucilaginibacter rubeus]
MNRLERVIFFSKRDLMAPHMLGNAEKLLDRTLDFGGLDLNDLIEFHHIQRYFEIEMFLTHWSVEQIEGYKAKVGQAMAAIRLFLYNLSDEEMVQEVGKLEFDNRESFWLVFRYFQLQKKVDRSVFEKILSTYPHHIRQILSLQGLVDHYNHEIRFFLFNYEDAAELLLSHYEQKRDGDQSNYHFPKSLTDTDKEIIITNYIESEDPNLNFIDLARNARQLKLSPKVRLGAKRISERKRDEIFNSENSIRIGVAASLDKNQVEPLIYDDKREEPTIVYGGRYFDSLATELELFNVFSDLFQYTDEEGLISLLSKDSEMDQLEKLFMHSKNEYQRGIVFERKNMLSLAQLGIMTHYLTDKGSSIEAILERFVHVFFSDVCGIKDLVFKMPIHSLTPAEKIKSAAPEIDYLIKQFKNFVIDGVIDHELLQLDSSPVHFSDVPSLLKKKYVFSRNDRIREIQHYFFDPNSILADRGDMEDRHTVFQRLSTQKTYKSEFEAYQQPHLERAIDQGYLHHAENDVIEMIDPVMVFIAGKLRKNGYISYWHISAPFRTAIDRLIREGFLETADGLFNKEEVSYLNFYLNMKEFSNAKDIRNKYLHGSHDRNAKRQEFDYMYFLRTIIVILLKLRDDLTMSRGIM